MHRERLWRCEFMTQSTSLKPCGMTSAPLLWHFLMQRTDNSELKQPPTSLDWCQNQQGCLLFVRLGNVDIWSFLCTGAQVYLRWIRSKLSNIQKNHAQRWRKKKRSELLVLLVPKVDWATTQQEGNSTSAEPISRLTLRVECNVTDITLHPTPSHPAELRGVTQLRLSTLTIHLSASDKQSDTRETLEARLQLWIHAAGPTADLLCRAGRSCLGNCIMSIETIWESRGWKKEKWSSFPIV